MYYDPGNGKCVVIDGAIVELDALRIAEAIKDYDENLEILCLDPSRAESITEEPFIIAERCRDGVLRPIFRAWKLDEMLLMRIRAADGQRVNGLATLEEMEANSKKASLRRYEEKRFESHDVAAHVLASPKSKYTVRDSNSGDLLTFYDDRPATRKTVV